MTQKGNFKFGRLNILESNENNNEFIIKDYDEDLPKKIIFGEREINTLEDCKNKENELTIPIRRIISSKQGTKSTINYKSKK